MDRSGGRTWMLAIGLSYAQRVDRELVYQTIVPR